VAIKYGCKWEDWCSNSVQGSYGVCLWKTIRKGWNHFSQFVSFKVGDGASLKFWMDPWCGEGSLREKYPKLYWIMINTYASVNDLLVLDGTSFHWEVHFIRSV
jgi:hypothetical protein